MILRLIFLLFFSSFFSFTYSQESVYAQSGYTSLSIHLSGKIPGQLPEIVRLHASNPFLQDKPVKFDVIDDSTMVLSFYTFGPTSLYFMLNGQPKNAMLLPNQHDELHLHYTDEKKYTLDYRGHFKEIFAFSHMFYAAVDEYFSSDYFVSFTPVSYRTAVAYREDILRRIADLQEGIGKNISSPLVRQFFQMGMETNNKNLFLFDSYTSTYSAYTADSTNQKITIPIRDLSYYTGIIQAHDADTTHLLAMNFNLLRNIRQSAPLELWPISEMGFTAYRDRLDTIFGHIFPQGKTNLFYDLMLAGAYIDQINEDRSLSLLQRQEIMRHFQNKHISNYLLYQDDMAISRRSMHTSTGGAHHLPFDRENTDVLKDILLKYKDKVIVMDFWATWCGPCMEASI